MSDAPTTSHPSNPNLGRYRLLQQIGQGGMGLVFQAIHTELDRPVAIKVLNSRILSDPQAIARFQREVKAVGRLTHPNIVAATDAGEENGAHFLAMELVDGIDVANVVSRNGPLSVSNACEIICQAATGLQHAHEHGMVHRDIKPSNLMLTVDGQIKILDFGLAVLHNSEQTLTATGQIMGTIDYMAPEQVSASHDVDIRADIYSLGATFYALLSGAPIFSGKSYDTTVKKMMAVVSAQPQSITERRPDLPTELVHVVSRMTEKDPSQRFQTPEEVRSAVAMYVDEADLPALAAAIPKKEQAADAASIQLPTETAHYGAVEVATDWQSSTSRPIAARWPGLRSLAALLCAAVLVVLLAYALRTSPTDQTSTVPPHDSPTAPSVPGDESIATGEDERWPPTRLVVNHPDFTTEFPSGVDLTTDVVRLDTEYGHSVIRKYLLDGEDDLKSLVFLFYPQSSYYIVEVPAHGMYRSSSAETVISTPYSLDETDDAERYRDSHGNQFVEQIIRTFATGNAPTTTLTLSDGIQTKLPEEQTDAVVLKDLTEWVASQRKRVTAVQGAVGKWLVREYQRKAPLSNIAVSTDGQRLLTNEPQPALIDLQTGEVILRFRGDSYGSKVVRFSSDDESVLVAQSDYSLKLFKTETGEVVRSFDGHVHQPWAARFSHDGTLLVSAGKDGTVRVWRVATGEQLAVFEDHAGEVRDAYFSPDDKFICSGGEDGVLRLWSVAGKEVVHRFPQQPDKISCVVLTPDGSRIVTSCDDGVGRVYDLETRALVHTLDSHQGWALRVAVSPDSQRAATCGADKTIRLWDLDTGKQTQRCDGHKGLVWSVEFSNDGKFVYSCGTGGLICKWQVAEPTK